MNPITNPGTNSILAFSLLIISIVGISHILLMLGRENPTHIKYLKWAHRISGYIFSIIYLFISFVMLQKLTTTSIPLSAKDAIHAYIGISIFPMIIVKVCIVRLYKKFYNALPIYGMFILTAVYLAVTFNGGYYILSLIKGQYIILPEKGRFVKINVNIGRRVVQHKCSTCHSLERVYAYVKTEEGWREYVSRMRSKDPALFSDQESLQALGYLVKNLGVEEAKMDIEIGIRIILEKCHKCHTLERIFTSKKTQAEWSKTIELMRSFDPNLLNNSEARQVNYYLSNVLAKQKGDS